MKKILLATTILAATAGFASADITFTGSASAGVAKDADTAATGSVGYADDTFYTYSNLDLVVTAAGQTDSGLSFGASFDASAGDSYALADDDGFSGNGGTFGTPTIFVSGSFGKVTFSDDNLDFPDTDAANGDGTADIAYDGTFGGFGVGLVADIDSGDMAASGSYTIGGVALAANYNQNGAADAIWNVSAAYTMGAFTGTIGTDDASASYITVAYSANGISASATANSDNTIDLSAGYSANGISINADTSDVSGANTWTVTAGYDLGNGLSLEAGTNYTGDVMVGAAMSF